MSVIVESSISSADGNGKQQFKGARRIRPGERAVIPFDYNGKRTIVVINCDRDNVTTIFDRAAKEGEKVDARHFDPTKETPINKLTPGEKPFRIRKRMLVNRRMEVVRYTFTSIP